MPTSYQSASLAIQHFSYAGLLACLFAAVTVVYLVAMWQLAGSLRSGMRFLLHTLYLLWQSNIAFVAVVGLSVAVEHAAAAGPLMQGWSRAPYIVPAAALLYTTIMILSLAVTVLRARSVKPGAADE